MTRAHKVTVILVVVTVAVWGCSQGDNKATSSRHHDRIKSLEAKCAKLEQDCQAALAERDQIQQRLSDLEKERLRLTRQVESHKLVCQERDDLKTLVNSRTTERDAYQGQLMEIRKGIRTLLSRVDAALPPSENSDQKTSMIPGF